ncbi:MAG: helix-turn-helix transcriptional regulator [Myxococcota bacterium]
MVTARKLYEDIGQRVKTLRLEQGITQAELAGRLRLDETSIRSIEAGRRGMSLETLTRVSRALRARPGALLGDGTAASAAATEAAHLLEELPREWQRAAVRIIREIHGAATGKQSVRRRRAK